MDETKSLPETCRALLYAPVEASSDDAAACRAYLEAIAHNPDAPHREGGPLVEAAARIHRELRRLQQATTETCPDGEADLLPPLRQALKRELARTSRFATGLALVLLEVEPLEDTRRTRGERVAEAVLTHVEQELRRLARAVDTVCRTGDHLAVVLPEEGAAGAQSAARRWVRALEDRPFEGDGFRVRIALRAGVACHPDDAVDTASGLLQAARSALLFARTLTRETVMAYRDLPRGTSTQLEGHRVEDLAQRVQALLRRSRSQCLDSIWAMVRAIEVRDGYTGRHSMNVHGLSVRLAQQMQMTSEQIETVAHAAMLHDIGKIGVPDSILMRPGSLTRAQWTIITRHPVIGCRILSQASFLRRTVPAVRHHHEWWDGSGYPDRLQGTQIPLSARILAAPDVYDAMTSDRVYRPALAPEVAMAEIRGGRGTHFDPEVVDAFERLWGQGDLADLAIPVAPTVATAYPLAFPPSTTKPDSPRA